MEAIVTKEIATPKPSANSASETAWQDKRKVHLEERFDLTISELEKLGITDPYELIDGRIIFKMANPKHSHFQGEIHTELGIYLRQNPIGVLFPDLSLRLFPNDEGQLRRPDLAFYLNENAPISDEPPMTAPDLAIEIFTSDTGFLALLDKADLYLSKGGKVVWIIIPAKASVLVWKATERRWEYETLTCPELLPSWSLDLKKFFVWPKTTKAL
ncbi:MAG: Uma2 family endonuclease [candidate division KSB1 bacterium]|nr:Uma2 family endonuclease [candidate division KSB1 bacterium]MDZ7366834.1 Uma2 family endonuclease [candidate division KSB1 bacterium]MDZ7405159.1 Uma2 family endonuclease [candidate division KSB1 bacterium]